MDRKQYEEYIKLCKKLYFDKDFKRFIELHTLKSAIDEVEAYKKILNDMNAL